MMISDFPQKISISLARIILVAVFLTAFSGCLTGQRYFVASRPFDEKVWKDFNSRAERPGMARDLVSRKALNGKTRDEVRAMLGQERPKVSFDAYSRYELALIGDTHAGLDPGAAEYLKVNFGDDGKVTSAEIEVSSWTPH